MANPSAGNAFPGGRTGVRIVVAGDQGSGKSSLICTMATDVFPAKVPPVLPPARLPEDFYPDRVPLTIIDTSTRVKDSGKLPEELRRADAVVLTYACDQLATLYGLGTFWLRELRRLEVKVPVIVVGCKLDLIDEHQQISLDGVMASMKCQFWEIETCIKCSAYRQIQIPEVFYYAQKAVLRSTSPLFDQKTQTLKPRCVRALKQIFLLCDHDIDDALSDAELNDLQVPSSSDSSTSSLDILRKFSKHVSCVELTNEAIEYLKRIFKSFDVVEDGALRPTEIEDLFSTAPEFPWNEAPDKDAAEKTALGGLSLDGFLSQWALMALLDPARTLENLICIGYPGDPSSAIRVTKTRRSTRKKQQSDRNVFQCLVFGPKKAGKSALLNSFLGRPFSDAYSSTTDERYAVNFVDQPRGVKKTLVLREIPEDGVKEMLVNKKSLAAFDMAVFVPDRSDESSWKRATELLVEVASHGEISGFEVSCLIVAAKDGMDPFPMAIQDSTRVSHDMGIGAPIPLSTKLGDLKKNVQKDRESC